MLVYIHARTATDEQPHRHTLPCIQPHNSTQAGTQSHTHAHTHTHTSCLWVVNYCPRHVNTICKGCGLLFCRCPFLFSCCSFCQGCSSEQHWLAHWACFTRFCAISVRESDVHSAVNGGCPPVICSCCDEGLYPTFVVQFLTSLLRQPLPVLVSWRQQTVYSLKFALL